MPVLIIPPNFLKNEDESLFFKYDFVSYSYSVEKIEPANIVFPSIQSVPIEANVKFDFLFLNFSYNRNTSS